MSDELAGVRAVVDKHQMRRGMNVITEQNSKPTCGGRWAMPVSSGHERPLGYCPHGKPEEWDCGRCKP